MLRREEDAAGGPDAGAPRYLMLETIREFARERLAASDEETSVRQRHALYCLALAERVTEEDWGPRFAASMDRLEDERDNLRAALGWAVERRDAELGLRLGQELHFFWRIRGPAGEGRDWLERVLALGAGRRDRLWLDNLMHAGDLAYVQGDLGAAVAHLDAALALARELGDPEALAYALLDRGLTAFGCDEDERARELMEEALALFRAQGNASQAAMMLNNLGTVAWRQGDPRRALALHEEALAISRDLRIAWLEAKALASMADAAADLGDDRRAAALYRESLAALWESGDRRAFAGSLAGFAGLVAACGQHARAARLCGAAAALVDACGATMPAFGRTNVERATAAARAGLDDAAFLAALAAGRAMTPAQVLAEVEADLPLPPARSVPANGGRREPGATLGLTKRELAVLRLLAEGLSDREIAATLSISPRTASGHVTHLLAKLGVESRTAAAAYALRHDLA